MVFQTICQGWLRTPILLISASQVAKIIGVSHQTWQVTKLLKSGFSQGILKGCGLCSFSQGIWEDESFPEPSPILWFALPVAT
jgi:hypothetical protein